MGEARQTVTVRAKPKTRDIEAQARVLMLAIVDETKSRPFKFGELHPDAKLDLTPGMGVDSRWADLFLLVQQPVLNVLRYVFGIANPEDQDDMFQEVMLRLYRYHLSYDPSRALLPWLYAIARNVKRDWNAKFRPAPESPVEPQKSDNTTVRLIAEQVLARLSEEDRQVLWLSCYEGLSNAEISEYLNVPLTTTKFYLRRAKKNARDLLSEYSRAGRHNET